jgi:hypothetical protein
MPGDRVCLAIQTVDTANAVGKGTSLALDKIGNPFIAYYDDTVNDLKYAKLTGGTWAIQIIDSEGYVGESPSLELDSSGYPCISYYDGGKLDLKYAKWTGTSWSKQTIDTTGNVGDYSSLALDSNDNPSISYHDYTNLDLKYAVWTGFTWSVQTVDSEGWVGLYTSITLDSKSHPWISYYDDSKNVLKCAIITGETTAQTSLKITVKDEAGNPVSGASGGTTAQLSGQASLKDNSNSDGVVLFSDVKPGSYTIKADKDGYQAATTTVSVTSASTAEVTLTLKVASTKGDLKVTVKDKDGKPIAGASVSSTTQPSGQQALSGATGSDGVVTLSGVAPGSYTMQASKSGYVSASTQGAVTVGSVSTVSITLQTQTTGGDGTSGGGIPGFPLEATLLGVMLSALLLAVHAHYRRQ